MTEQATECTPEQRLAAFYQETLSRVKKHGIGEKSAVMYAVDLLSLQEIIPEATITAEKAYGQSKEFLSSAVQSMQDALDRQLNRPDLPKNPDQKERFSRALSEVSELVKNGVQLADLGKKIDPITPIIAFRLSNSAGNE